MSSSHEQRLKAAVEAAEACKAHSDEETEEEDGPLPNALVFKPPTGQELGDANLCPLCVPGSNKTIGHKGRHSRKIQKPRVEVPAELECRLCVAGNRKPVGHKGPHCTKRKAEGNVHAPKQAEGNAHAPKQAKDKVQCTFDRKSQTILAVLKRSDGTNANIGLFKNLNPELGLSDNLPDEWDISV